MSSVRQVRTPTYRHHKPSGRAVLTIDGKDFYLGKWRSEESKAEYQRVVGEWLANGRRLPTANGRGPCADLTVDELIAAYWLHARSYYVKDGNPSSEISCIRQALRPLKRLYGHTETSQFGPLALKAVRNVMIQSGWCRKMINDNVGRIKRVFKWGVENELVPPSVFHGLQAVVGLRRGRSEAHETEPVRPVPDAHVDAIKPFVSRQVWAMIELQRLTGMRAGEVVIMCGRDLDVTGDLWFYRPSTHKTAHHGHERLVDLGPRAQAIIRPFLKADFAAYLFSPADAAAECNAERRRRRQTPMTPSQARRKRRRNPKRKPGDHYTTASYGRAIGAACKRGGVPHWTTHQLRHSFATRIRKQYGLETARAMLGHRSIVVTEIYAELDRTKVARVVARPNPS
ncbi:MAG: tyrosine-type recombinase/integrase, partial [Planctomycetes bacterium]|nr:tyrosine-type recombinase/integrase [Planctomycetota bacterium]